MTKQGGVSMNRILLFVSLLTFVFCSMGFAQFDDVIDGQKNDFYTTLTGPENGHFFIPSEAYIEGNGVMPDDNDDLSALVWTGWDDMYLYFYVEVTDDNVQLINTTDWQNDCVEVKMDPDPLVGATSGICAINLTALGEEDATGPAAGVGGWSNLDADDNWPGTPNGADDYFRELTDVGYNLEFRLAIDQILIASDGRQLYPEVGSILGIAFNVHENDAVSGGRDGSIQWSAVYPPNDGVWGDPQMLGQAELLEGNKIRFTPENFFTGAYHENPEWFNPPPTGISEDQIGNVADDFALEQNYPNPFNPSTNISYTLQKPSEVKIGVYDLLGHEVAMLVNGMKPAGTNTVQFDGSNLSSGIYIYKLQTVDQVMNRKMMLLK
jgi:hypothetical protein